MIKHGLECASIESSKARLRNIRERRDHIRSAPSRVSHKSSHPSERGLIDLEECKTTPDHPADFPTLADGGALPPDGDAALPFKSPSADSYKRAFGAPTPKASDHPASTSMDAGLRLLQQAINKRGGRFWYLENFQAYCETPVSIDSSLGQDPSFLDDTCKPSLFEN